MFQVLLYLLSSFVVIIDGITETRIVKTIYGSIRGKINEYGTSFSNIPFAEPPINDLRWSPPQKLTKKWIYTLNATSSDNIGCPQSCSSGSGTNTYWCSPIISEDCLLLNIWTPKQVDCNDKIPVLVYIYGGGFVRGVSNNIFINGTIIANLTNNIIVTINYRLGALGFYYDDEINIFGNFGYFDQILGIEWVYNNIEYFCGNKEKIIIYGESAGASSVILHTMNISNNIIKGAIMESLPMGQPLNTPFYWNTNNISTIFSESCGCPMSMVNSQRLQCLKSVDYNFIIQEQNGIRWTPMVDKNIIIDQPIFAYQHGEFNKNIPIIIGICSGEQWYFIQETRMSFSELELILIEQFGLLNTNKITNFYNISILNENIIDKYSEIYTDFIFKCPSRNKTAEYSKYVENNNNNNNLNSYYFHFKHISSFMESLYGNTNPGCLYDACHTAEIFYVWNNDLSSIDIQFNNDEKNLAKQINFYWSNFANSGNPNIGDWNVNIEWQHYSKNNQTLIIDIGDNMKMENNIDLNVCQFWDNLQYEWVNIP